MNYDDDSDEEKQRGWFGTPFAPLEKKENAPKKADLDLTVRDEKGRQRFHGAFTGGFSAGHFNTVGSIEGWVPSQFKSSRVEKWSRDLLKHKPEDYMDEEDMGVFGIAPRTVQTTEKFTGDLGGSFAGFRDTSKTVTDVLRDIVKPSQESIGVKIFKRLKLANRNKNVEAVPATTEAETGPKVYGCQLPSNFQRDDIEVNEEELAIIEKFELPYKPKIDQKGLGYSGMQSTLIGSSKRGAVEGISATIGGKRLKITGEAFGLGALSDEDDLDEDAEVYGQADMAEYDFAIGGKGDRKKSSSTLLRSVLNMEKLEGFIKESSKRTTFIDLSRKFPRPRVPKHWRPRPPWGSTSKSEKRKSRWDVPAKSDERQKKSKYNEGYNKEAKKDDDEPRSKYRQSREAAHNAHSRALQLDEEVIQVKKEPAIKRPPTPEKPTYEFEVMPQPQPVLKPLHGFFACKFTRSDKEATETNQLVPGLIKPTEFKEPEPSKDTDKKEEQNQDVSDIGNVRRVTYQWHPAKLLSKRFNIPPPFPQFPDVIGVVTFNRKENIRNRTAITADSKQQSSGELFTEMIPLPSEPAPTAGPSSGGGKEKVVRGEQRHSAQGSDPERKVPKDGKGQRELSGSGSDTVAASRDASHNEGQTELRNKSDKEENEGTSEDEQRPPLDLFRAIFASDEERESESDTELPPTDTKKEETKENDALRRRNEIGSASETNKRRIESQHREDEGSSGQRAAIAINETAENGNERGPAQNTLPIASADGRSRPPDIDKRKRSLMRPESESIANEMSSAKSFTSSAGAGHCFSSRIRPSSDHRATSATTEANTLNANNAINMDSNFQRESGSDDDYYFGPALPPATNGYDDRAQLATRAAANDGHNSADDIGDATSRSGRRKSKHKKKDKRKKRKKDKKKKDRHNERSSSSKHRHSSTSESDDADDESDPDVRLIDQKLSALIKAKEH